jgi:hypothetical protein
VTADLAGRLRRNADVVGAVVRATYFGPLVWCAALSVGVLLVPILLGADLDFLDATLTLHLAMVAMLLGAAFVLDDPARPLTEVLPISPVTSWPSGWP